MLSHLLQFSPMTLRSAAMMAAMMLLVAAPAGAQQEQRGDCEGPPRYTFSWSMSDACALEPRGGTSPGAPVTLDPDPHPGWEALQEAGLPDRERDRRAILAMAGPYRASFEFLETVGYTPDFQRARPYHSWGTEYIYVVEEQEDFISLQHIMVMFTETEEGERRGPFVQKHWRQDWRYEPREILVHAGHDSWEKETLSAEEAAGTWAQTVYQVDDSPRYASYGPWRHHANMSTWRSRKTWRPLPRRESAARDDYDVLIGWNVHTIVPDGWVHEEENYKVRLDEDGNIAGQPPYLAKEQGVNRYDRIVGFDFAAGDRYWEETAPFWAQVREVWQDYVEDSERLTIADTHEDMPMFAALFQLAEEARQGEFDADEVRERVRAVLDDYVSAESTGE